MRKNREMFSKPIRLKFDQLWKSIERKKYNEHSRKELNKEEKSHSTFT